MTVTQSGVHIMGEIADTMCDQLDRILDRALRNDSVLALYRTFPGGPESGLYTVLDLANGFVRMVPPASRDFCVRFACAFVAKHPEATLDATFSGEPMWAPDRAPAETDPSGSRIPARLRSTVPQAAVPSGEPASPEFSVRVGANVVPIR